MDSLECKIAGRQLHAEKLDSILVQDRQDHDLLVIHLVGETVLALIVLHQVALAAKRGVQLEALINIYLLFLCIPEGVHVLDIEARVVVDA